MLTRSPVTPRKVGADANASTPSAKGTPTRTSKTWLFNLSKSKAAKEKQEEAKNKELRSSVVRRSATQRSPAKVKNDTPRSFSASNNGANRRFSNPDGLGSPSLKTAGQLSKEFSRVVQANNLRNSNKASPASRKSSHSTPSSRKASTSFTIMLADVDVEETQEEIQEDVETDLAGSTLRSSSKTGSVDAKDRVDEGEEEFRVQSIAQRVSETTHDAADDHNSLAAEEVDDELNDEEEASLASVLDETSELQYEHLGQTAESIDEASDHLPSAPSLDGFGKLSSQSGYISLGEHDKDNDISGRQELPESDQIDLEDSTPKHEELNHRNLDSELRQMREEVLWLRQQLAISEVSRQQLERELKSSRDRVEELDVKIADERYLRQSYEQQLKRAEDETSAVEIASIQIKELRDQLNALNGEYEEARNQLCDSHEREQEYMQKTKTLEEALELLREEKADLYEQLQEERNKTSRNEGDFRTFSRKIQYLQDSNTQMKHEMEQLRMELRRMQYEAPSPTTPSTNDNFFKERLDEALAENSIMRKLLQEHKPDWSARAVNDNVSKHGADIYSASQGANYHSQVTSRAASPGLSRARSFPVWDRQNPTSHTNEQKAFGEKMRAYENEPCSPTGGRAAATQLSPDNPFARVSAAAEPVRWGTPNAKVQNWTGLEETPSSFRGSGRADVLESSTSYVSQQKPSPSNFLQVRDKLSAELRQLTDRKALLTSQVSKIPINGGRGPQRRLREEIEAELDELDKKVGYVRRKMREVGMI